MPFGLLEKAPAKVRSKLHCMIVYLCQEFNIPLASNRPDKCFGPTTRGIVMGIEFDTENWTWSLPEDRRLRLLADLKEVRNSESCSLTQMRSVVGKLNSICSLVPGGKYLKRDILDSIASFPSECPGSVRVNVSQAARDQLGVWLILIPSLVSLPIQETSLLCLVGQFTFGLIQLVGQKLGSQVQGSLPLLLVGATYFGATVLTRTIKMRKGNV